jgi:fructosamine-3-kinase
MPLPYDADAVFERPFTGFEPVYGGDINRAFCMYGSQGRCFLKVNDAARFPRMFEQEAAGLNALRQNSAMAIPEVIQHGVYENQQFLLLSWIEKGQPRADFWESFGGQTAQLHQCTSPQFGWLHDNYMGSLQQCNTYCNTWAEFYSLRRILPLVRHLYDAGYLNETDTKAAENFCLKLPQLFPAEPPALLHGDLWNGNFMVTAEGAAAIFDPAVYYGHREMDLGMTRLFGGFNTPFYAGYHNVYPLQPGWAQRLAYSQLYPLLVHAVLFGGHYVQSCRDILAAWR